MSDDPWKPIHHVEADDPEVQEGGGEQKPAPEKRESNGGTGETKSTVMLSLELPADFSKAVVRDPGEHQGAASHSGEDGWRVTAIRDEIMAKLHRQNDPWSGIIVDDAPAQIQGWNSNHP